MSSLGRNVSSGASLACFDDAADEERLGSPYVDATKLPPMPTVDGKGESLPGPLFCGGGGSGRGGWGSEKVK